MSHLSEFNTDAASVDGRALGDEWADWDGRGGGTIQESSRLFLIVTAFVLLALDGLSCVSVYMISPRLSAWASWLPMAAWTAAILSIVTTTVLYLSLLATVVSSRSSFASQQSVAFLFNLVFSHTFRIAQTFRIPRDRIGHSFVRVSNAVSRALKPIGRQEKLLLLLPRCLAREELQAINQLKARYPFDVHTVSGGELARKKVRELKPTAVIGVACERDLVSGIRDVGQKISVIGIPNQRPEGPCKNTHIDMSELIAAVEFYVGPAQTAECGTER